MSVHFIYLDTYINLNNYTDPYMTYIRSDILEGSINAMRTDQFFFKKVDYITDSGWLFSDPDDTSSMQLDYNANFVHPLRPMYTFWTQVSLSYLKDIYTRQYIKVQEVLASTLGILEIAKAVFAIIHSLYIDKMFLRHLLKYFLKKAEHSKEIEMVNNGNNMNQRGNSQVDFIVQEPKEERPMKVKTKSGGYFIYELLCACKGRKREDVRLLMRFERLYAKALDVKTFLKNTLKLKINDRILYDSKSLSLKRLILYSYVEKFTADEKWKLNEFDLCPESKSMDEHVVKLYNHIST
jgi:hypothetical protein